MSDSPPRGPRPGWNWHVAALFVFSLAAAFNSAEWFRGDRMPLLDFPGYAAQVQATRDALLAHGRLPRWCLECYGGSSIFSSQLKEILAFPLVLASDPITATKALWVLLRVVAGLGLYLCVFRLLAEPGVGIVAGYAYAFGALPNAQVAHLDMALAAALLPYLWIALVEHFRDGRARWTLALGILTACLFANNWVYAFVAPFAALAVWALRPWQGRALAPGWAQRSAAALGIFAVFGASTLVWMAADAPHHALVDPERAAEQREVYVERSPFLFVNRDGVLNDWLATHQPPGFDLARLDGDRRYLGWIVLAVSAFGWILAPRGSPLRLAAGVAAGLLWFQYWLALGPRTLLWELGASFGWSDAGQDRARGLLLLCAALSAAVAWTKRRDPGGRALWLVALLLVFPSFSLWNTLAALLPPLEVQRSPGHFFDTAHFWLGLGFAASAVAIARSLGQPGQRLALVAALGLAVAIDFAPSRRHFAEGQPMAPLREAAAMLASVEGEGGTLRAAPPPGYGPRASWVLSQSELGHAWGWLSWQAGKHWYEPFRSAAYAHPRRLPSGAVLLKTDSETLAELRVRYFLLPREGVVLPEPWQRVDSGGPFTLWQQPDVLPYARGLREAALEQAPGSRASAFPVSSARPHPERIRLELDAGAEPGWVLVSESYHPWWRARVDDAPSELRRARGSLMAVPVRPGPHRVELRFQPPWPVRLAEGLSAAAWLALLPGLAGAGWVRRRRSI